MDAAELELVFAQVVSSLRSGEYGDVTVCFVSVEIDKKFLHIYYFI
jgi:hypothetical protein